MKRKDILPAVVTGMGLLLLTGFGSGSVIDSSAQNQVEEAPQLLETGSRLVDFVPEGWEIVDSVELDFNEDGAADYVGVLRAADIDMVDYVHNPEDYPCILFAIAGDGKGKYHQDFQDTDLLWAEICNYDDTLRAEGTSFTTYTKYGSGVYKWKRSGSPSGCKYNTYTYREGHWWHTSSETTCRYGDYVTDYRKDDWEKGVGVRKKRSSDGADIEKNWDLIDDGDYDFDDYDVEYEVALDEPPLSLEQIRTHRELSPDNVTDWELKTVTFAADVALTEDGIKLPNESLPLCPVYWDDNCVLYAFSSDSDMRGEVYYVTLYSRQDKALSILAGEESEIDDLKLYKGKIYYSSEIVENVTYRTTEEGKEKIAGEEETVGIRLNRMELDGTGKETIFEYRYQEQGIMENRPPYLGLDYEIGGEEIVVQVHIGDGHSEPFYRMKTDGSGQEKIGQMPK